MRIAETSAEAGGLSPVRYAADGFSLAGWLRRGLNGPLTVYLEGDGFAWRSRHQPSDDPTPLRPIGLQLAAADPTGSVLALARPCQYSPDGPALPCEPRYWTSHRFAPEVIAALSIAIDRAKAATGATTVRLVGFSGGGVAAALLAAGREDVVQLVTIAAPLDLAAWTRLHGVSPLTGSVDPMSEPGVSRLARVRQVHVVGGRDTVVPPELSAAFTRRLGVAPPLVVAERGHDDEGWSATWTALWPRIRTAD